MTGLKYKKWTEKEDKVVIDCFFYLRDNYKPNRNQFRYIKLKLLEKGFVRTEKGIGRRFHRLKLKFYDTSQKDVELKCENCGQKFIAYERYLNRSTNRMIRCFECAKINRKNWDIKHHEYMLKYYKEWRRINKGDAK